MSRYAKEIEGGRTLEYGFDRSPFPGYFAEIFDEDGALVEGGDTRKMMAYAPGEHLSRGGVLELLTEHEAPQDHIKAVGLDQPF